MLIRDESIDLWATDEVHFQQYGSRCRMWVPPEVVDPILLHFPGRKSIGYFGAVRLRDGKFIFEREAEKFNGESFFAFMKKLRSRVCRTQRKVLVITDNASYHHSRLHKEWRETHSDKFALEYLPPYSPDLNPIERVWKLTRRIAIHDKYFERLEDVSSVVEECFADWISPNHILRRLCAIS